MSTKYVISGALNAPTAPILGFDEGQIVEGALLYLEPARDGLSAVPSIGQKFTNWARGSFVNLTGAGTEAASPVMADIGAGVSSGFEMTSAGSLHGYFDTAAGDTSATEKWRLDLPQEIIDYIDANSGNDFYMDAVIRSTADVLQAEGAGTDQYWMLGISEEYDSKIAGDVFFGIKHLANTSNTITQNNLVYPASNWATIISSGRDLWEPAPLVSHARMGREGAGSAFSSARKGFVLWTGPRNLNSRLAGGQSFIFYSMYLEDLTVSGRTYADVFGWRSAQMTADFGAGGRYFGETWTDPATVVW